MLQLSLNANNAAKLERASATHRVSSLFIEHASTGEEAVGVAALAQHPARQRPKDALHACQQRRQRIILQQPGKWLQACSQHLAQPCRGYAKRMAEDSEGYAHPLEQDMVTRPQRLCQTLIAAICWTCMLLQSIV